MPIPDDARTFALWRLRAMPASRFGLWLGQFLDRGVAGQLPDGLERRTVQIPRSGGGGSIRTVVISPKSAYGPLPIVVHYHGGGYIMGTPESALDRALMLQEATPCVLVMPAYRLAKDAPYPAGHDDCYDALVWAAENADQLGGRADRIAIGGESAGGGLTLATALRARDEGKVTPAFMFPIYPMIDDRRENWTEIAPQNLSWTPAFNRLGWELLLGGKLGQVTPPRYAAPAHIADYANLPPAFSFIGTEDMFLDETRKMIAKLREGGVEVVYQEFPNAYHALEEIAPEAKMAAEINTFYRDSIREMFRRYC